MKLLYQAACHPELESGSGTTTAGLKQMQNQVQHDQQTYNLTFFDIPISNYPESCIQYSAIQIKIPLKIVNRVNI